MLESIIIRNKKNQTLLRKDLVGGFSLSDDIINLNGPRNIFELDGRSYLLIEKNELKFYFISKKESPFVLKACLEIFLNILSSLKFDFTEEKTYLNIADIHFILNYMFPSGKIAEIDLVRVQNEYRDVLKAFKKSKT